MEPQHQPSVRVQNNAARVVKAAKRHLDAKPLRQSVTASYSRRFHDMEGSRDWCSE